MYIVVQDIDELGTEDVEIDIRIGIMQIIVELGDIIYDLAQDVVAVKLDGARSRELLKGGRGLGSHLDVRYEESDK
jgi:hypothetical protein